MASNEAKRAEILAAAMKVFAAKGYEGASVRDVAKESGIADGTLYNYFLNKEALMQELMVGLLADLAKKEEAPLGLIEAEGLEARLLARMRALHGDYERVSAVLPFVLARPALRTALRDSFVVPVAEALRSDLESAYPGGLATHADDMAAVDSLLSSRILLAAVLGFQVLMLLDDEPTRSAWEEPSNLARVWTRFVKAARPAVSED